ncbi:MAG: SRPBCC family protein [Ferruginibacter sp.]
MKIIKKILIGLATVVLLLLILALFVSKDYKVERSITINKPKTEIFNYIKYLKNQNEYSKWARMDTGMRKVFMGTDATPGFISAWRSSNKDVGMGEQEIKKIIDGQQVDYEIRFEKPMKDVATSFMRTDSIGANETVVKWQIAGHMTYPGNLMGLVMDKLIGGDLQTGLENLKKLQEAR